MRYAVIIPSLHGKTTLAKKVGPPYYDVDDAASPDTEDELKRLRRSRDWDAHNKIWHSQIEAWVNTLPDDAIIMVHHPANVPDGIEVLGLGTELLSHKELIARYRDRVGGTLTHENLEGLKLAAHNLRDVRALELDVVPGVLDHGVDSPLFRQEGGDEDA